MTVFSEWMKLHFKARAGETGVGAEPLPQERGQLVGKRVTHVGSARAGHVAGDLREPKLPLPAIRQPHEHRPSCSCIQIEIGNFRQLDSHFRGDISTGGSVRGL